MAPRKPKAETGAREVPAPVLPAEPLILAEPPSPSTTAPIPPSAAAPEAEAAAEATTKAELKAADGAVVPHVIVVGPTRGRYRIGRHFGPEAVTIPLLDLNDDQLAALQADPLLKVSLIET